MNNQSSLTPLMQTERYPDLHKQRENYWLDIEFRQTKAEKSKGS
ncbi:MAG: hypothetical protein Q8N35_14990 [Methylococcaceae bacterium]|nr:hypothetical protein [Methylococcaceae bacterium]MDP2392061.1 hypothetical protein [Methylococcaceae bacterium]MDP3020887.1 hypothetical protein [Methylococcaceae bacterium]MDP3933790.1 hypothetical protein [Methylococcaceae bacterium]MDZ4155970.1 hypothetical protein [Methylococcales bacterium]